MVRREETSPNGDGSIRRYFCGEAAAAEKEAAVAAAAADGEAAAEVGADNGAHRLRFGDAGLSSGSKSRVLFRVAPHAMAGDSRGARVGSEGKGEERALAGRPTDGAQAEPAGLGAPAGDRTAAAAAASAAGAVAGTGPGGSGRGGGGAHASRVRGGSSASSGAAPQGEARAAPAVRSGFAPRLRRSCSETGSLRKSIPAPGRTGA